MEKATSVPKKGKSAEKLEDKIISAYISYVLEHGHQPPSVFQFAKSLNIKEVDFYNTYGSFTALEKDIWLNFFNTTVEKITNDKIYAEYAVREKALSFYFTMIEVLKQQRSYALFCWRDIKKTDLTPEFLKQLKEGFIDFMRELLSEGAANEEVVERPIISKRYADAMWIQFLFVVNFWIKDESKAFEKTDAAIEKAVNLSFDLMGKSTLDTMADFAKFLYQNR